MDAAPSLHIWQQQQHDLCPAPTTTRTQPSAVRIPASRTITAAATTTTSTHTPIAPPPASDTTIRASRVLIPSSAPIAPTVLVTATSSPTKRAGTYIYPSRDLRSARPTPFNLNKALVNKENESIERSEPIDRSEPPARKLMDSSRLRIRPNGPPPPPKQPKQVPSQTQSHKERQDDGDRDVAQKELPRPPLQSRPPQVTSVPISSSSTVAEDDHPLPTPPNSIPTAPTKSEPESSLPRPSKLKPPGQQVGTSAGAPSKLPRPPTSTQPSSLPSLIRPPKTQHTVASSLPKPITHSLIRNKARLSPPSAMAGASASSSSDRSGGMMSRYAGTRLRARASLTASSSRVRVTKEVMAAASAAAAAKTAAAAAAAASASAEAPSAPLSAPAQTEQVSMDVPAPPPPLGPSAITRPSPVLGTTALPSLIPMPASRIARPQTPAESKVPSIPQLQPAPTIIQPPPIRLQTKAYPTALTITAKELSKLTALHTRRNEVQAVRIRFKTVRVEGRRRPPSPTSRIRRVGEPVLGVGGDEDGEMGEGEENGPGAGPLDLVDATAVVGAERPSGEGSGKESPVGSDDLEGEGDAEVVEEEEGAEVEDKEAAVKVEGEDVAVDTEGWAEDGQDVATQSRPQLPTRSASASSTTTTPSVPLRPRSLRILRSSSTPTAAEAGGSSAISSSSSVLLSTGKRRVRWDEVPRKVKRFVPPLYRARLGVYAVGSASGASSSSSSAAGGMPTGSGAGVIVGRSCFASKVQDVKLDPLGNAPDADRPLPLQTQLRRTKVVVKRYVYDGEDEEDGGGREEQPMINVDVGGAGSSVSALRSGLTSASGPALRRGATVLGGGTL
ncbi:hypothetical protein CF326_g5253 [Tilletia indica]|nr:hypothetical protein CF326_g5253 [Tilletia indica]